MINDLNDRSRQVFREIVESYVADGEPVGSQTLSQRLRMPLSPATIRNVMAELEDMGLLYSPHKSAGRLPTDAGLRMFVDGLLEIGDLSSEDRENIDARCVAHGTNLEEALGEATSLLSGLAKCAGLVIAPKTALPLKHVEFVNLGDGRVLAVLVTDEGFVENRIINMPRGTPPSALVQAGNYLNARLTGKTINDARQAIAGEIDQRRAQIDEITSNLIEAGLAAWSGDGNTGSASSGSTLIVKGQSRLLDEISAAQDLERVRGLFQALETEELLVKLLDVTDSAEGVQIFIGAENTLFDQAGCSLVVAPFKGENQAIVGAIGVIGPTRLNYARIIPMVDYTAQVIDRIIR
ncbi:MAG: Heat-inducible transcription repressor HrcA [Alphaproteobacteria bacterium MarineAlpha11_Bin1]|nr:MAG: Heat-inducible transcription repressor HrcA [Alphaproteobacteria bacterium MarineAlpha11_Bin1]|tara:strand:+ start:8441 stop:9493 length:1053 start_codon:yes stop_codon:yes gene_type:complete